MPIEQNDFELVQKACEGDKEALNKLVTRYYDFVFNVARRMVFKHEEALDITQDVIVRMITNLNKYTKDVSFKAWVYKMTVNHFLNEKEKKNRAPQLGFDDFDAGLDTIKDSNLGATPEDDLLLKEVKVSCTIGMLMCLSADQRLAYILGEILDVDHKTGAYIFDVNPSGFRKLKSRAVQDIRNFMGGRCGLIDPSNSCRCEKKARGFVAEGWIDPSKMTFSKDYSGSIAEKAEELVDVLETDIRTVVQKLYQDHPFYTPDNKYLVLKDLNLN
ncbi:RNA polymerase sigma factor [Kiloniella majae]|uniref:RNA polymerase sigma factor n=1 Tax=Kiloniella majae TaxID=1938558 RepID=UPI000A278B76|nr:RNA polymerase sigma factor [Kiloniella majae]